MNSVNSNEGDNQVMVEQEDEELKGLTPLEAIKIPGVLLYGFSFFCVKFAVYSLLLWLPLFLSNELNYSNTAIANMQTASDIGNLFGGAFLGLLSDLCYSKRSPAGIFAVLGSGIISLYITFGFHHIEPSMLATCLFMIGLLLGGLHHILCITVATDLGQNQMLKSNRAATSTVTGIIDGLGSLGTAFGQFLIGRTSKAYGWRYGYLLIISIAIFCTLIPLGKMFLKDLEDIREIR
jgi:OPA family glycerol-3-phosphate transporter-like MFS transporter 3